MLAIDYFEFDCGLNLSHFEQIDNERIAKKITQIHFKYTTIRVFTTFGFLKNQSERVANPVDRLKFLVQLGWNLWKLWTKYPPPSGNNGRCATPCKGLTIPQLIKSQLLISINTH